MLGRDECVDGPDTGGGGKAAVLNEDEWIGFAPSGPLPGPIREEEDVDEKERVGLSVLGVVGIEFELEVVRGGVGRVGGRDWGWGRGAGVGAGKEDEKDWVAKGEGDVGLCACEACVAYPESNRSARPSISADMTGRKRQTSVGEARILPHTSSLQSVPPPAPVAPAIAIESIPTPAPGLSALTVPLAPATKLSKSTG